MNKAESDYRSLRSKLLAPYRAERTTPRTDLPGFGPGDPVLFRDPAPPWVAKMVDTLMHRFTDRSECYRVIAMLLDWCSLGEPVSRAERVLTLVSVWPGPVGAVLDMFVMAAMDTKAGRPSGCKPKHARALRVFENWDEEHAARAGITLRLDGPAVPPAESSVHVSQ